jgi:hypothetical protein
VKKPSSLLAGLDPARTGLHPILETFLVAPGIPTGIMHYQYGSSLEPLQRQCLETCCSGSVGVFTPFFVRFGYLLCGPAP